MRTRPKVNRQDGISLTNLVVKDEAVAALTVDGGVRDVAETAHVPGEELFGYRFRDAVEPDAVGGHRLAKAELDPRVAHLLAVEAPHSAHHRGDVGVLAKGVGAVVVVVVVIVIVVVVATAAAAAVAARAATTAAVAGRGTRQATEGR